MGALFVYVAVQLKKHVRSRWEKSTNFVTKSILKGLSSVEDFY